MSLITNLFLLSIAPSIYSSSILDSIGKSIVQGVATNRLDDLLHRAIDGSSLMIQQRNKIREIPINDELDSALSKAYLKAQVEIIDICLKDLELYPRWRGKIIDKKILMKEGKLKHRKKNIQNQIRKNQIFEIHSYALKMTPEIAENLFSIQNLRNTNVDHELKQIFIDIAFENCPVDIYQIRLSSRPGIYEKLCSKFKEEIKDNLAVISFIQTNIILGGVDRIINLINRYMTQSEMVGKTLEISLDKTIITSNHIINALEKNYKIQPESYNIMNVKEKQISALTYNLPHRNEYFKGRSTYLEEIKDKFFINQSKPILQVVRGPGGIGKTQLALEYAHLNIQNYNHIWWVRANQNSINTEFRDIARYLELKNLDKISLIKVEIKKWLTINIDWLIIFDNVDEPEVLSDFIPTCSHGHILITSRKSHFDELHILFPNYLDKLEVEEAIEFLIDRTGKKNINDSELKAVEKLSIELGLFPLSLEQAAAYIYRKNLSFNKYLNDYRHQSILLLKKENPKIGDNKKSIFLTWNLNFEAVIDESLEALEFFTFSTFLSTDDIPYELYEKGYTEMGLTIRGAFENSNEYSDIISEQLLVLDKYSLIKHDHNSRIYSLYKPISEVYKTMILSDDDQFIWINRVINSLSISFPNFDYYNQGLCGRLFSHAKVAINFIFEYDIVNKLTANLLNKVGSYLYKIEDYKDAEKYYKKSLEQYIQIYGENEAYCANLYNDLGVLYKNLGPDYDDKAKKNILMSLSIREKVLGKNHVETSESLHNYAEYLLKKQQYEEAVIYYKKSIKIRIKTLGKNHPRFASSINGVATCYFYLGGQKNLRKAKSLYCFLQSCYLEMLNIGEYMVLSASMFNLANIYADEYQQMSIDLDKKKNIYKAIKLANESIDLRKNIQDDKHNEIAIMLNFLAGLYSDLGRIDNNIIDINKAEKLYVDALEILEKKLPKHHENIIYVQNNLAKFYADNHPDKYNKAEYLYTQALNSLKILGNREEMIDHIEKNLNILKFQSSQLSSFDNP